MLHLSYRSLQVVLQSSELSRNPLMDGLLHKLVYTNICLIGIYFRYKIFNRG